MESDRELDEIRARLIREMMAPAARTSTLALDHPVDVTDAEFAAFLRTHPLVFVDCWAEWCGPCHMMEPSIKQLAKEFAGRAVFAKVDADANPAIQRSFGVMSLPTLLAFRDGRLVDRVVGALPKPQLAAFVQRQLSRA